MNRFRVLVIVWLLVLTGWVAYYTGLLDNLTFPKQFTPQTKGVSSEDVPEMADILGPDQETRLKAGRRLVERVGVDQAQEILKNSSLPHTGEGHLVVHQIGFHAYKTYGIDSILKCKDYFLFACYHGAIIEAASDQGVEAITKMTDRCKEFSSRFFQCVHAAGHAILAMWEYDLPKALETCDLLYEKESAFPEALTSCHNGAFMENLFGVHDWGSENSPKQDWISEDPYYPCNYFSEKYQRGCWLNQAARIYQMNQGDLAKTAQSCQQIENSQYIIWCMDNLSRQIHALTNGEIAKVFSLCQYTTSRWFDSCIVINAGSYYSVGDDKTAIEICRQINPNQKTNCYQTIIAQIIGDSKTAAQKRDLCEKIEQPFNQSCFSQLRS